MSRPHLRISAILACALLATGCAAFGKKKKTEPRPPATPQPVLVGTIALVNDGGKFALIDNGMLPSPWIGAKLKSYTDGKPSAELVASDVHKRPFMIADIHSGAPHKGDRVYMDPAHGAAPQDPPAPAAPASPAASAADSTPGSPLEPQLAPTSNLDQ